MSNPKLARAVGEALKFNGADELADAAKQVLDDQAVDIETMATDKAMAAVEQRAGQIVAGAYMHQMNISPSGIQAHSMIDSVMQETLNRLAIILPDGWRSAKAFEILEESFVWAKRSVSIWDFEMQKREQAKGIKT